MLQDLRIHIQEIVDFLDNIVIKFDHFSVILNDKPEYALIEGFDKNDPATFPYYRILAGDVAFATVPLYGYLPDTQSDILLTRDNLDQYPNMVAFYKNNPDNVQSLLAKYPDDQFLIKRIFDPVTDIPAAINARNLSLLKTSSDFSHLDENEHSSLIYFLKEFLEMFEYRWYINVFEYEDLYPITYWSMLWYLLPLILLTKRVLNIKTNDVHPFHIWEYLTSVGFGSYKGYFTRKQEMFLYRNNDFLKYNVGKKFVLDILGDTFLKPIKYSLTEKVVVSHTEDREPYYDKEPEILSKYKDKIDYDSSTTFDKFLNDIHEDGHDDRNDTDHRVYVDKKFRKSSSNTLLTKFIELTRNQNNDQAMTLLKFILDTVAYLTSVNRLRFTVTISSPVSNKSVEDIPVIDALNIMFYCIYARMGDNPVNTFSKYTTSVALTNLTEPIIPTTINHDGDNYLLSTYMDLADIVGEVPYCESNIYDPINLSDTLGKQFNWLFTLADRLSTTYDSVIYAILHKVFTTFVPSSNQLTIPQMFNTFDDLFIAYDGISDILNELTTDADYTDLIYDIFAKISPLEEGFRELAEDDENASVLVHKVKDLFKDLTSYNVTFITPEVSRADTFNLPVITGHLKSTDNESKIDSLEGARNSYEYEIAIDNVGTSELSIDIESDVSCHFSDTSNIINGTTEDLQSDDPLDSICNRVLYITTVGAVASIEPIID